MTTADQPLRRYQPPHRRRQMRHSQAFANYEPAIRQQLQLNDDVSRWSVTDGWTADAMSRLLARLLRDISSIGMEMNQISSDNITTRNDYSVVDVTAGAGGNALSFVRHFGRVVVVEQDAGRYACLLHNLAQLQIQVLSSHDDHGSMCTNHYHQVHAHLGDCMQIMPVLNQQFDVVFVDPPWTGGPLYRELGDALSLSLGGLPLYMACRLLKPYCRRLLAVKVPDNFAFDAFVDEMRTDWMVVMIERSYHRQNLVVMRPL